MEFGTPSWVQPTPTVLVFIKDIYMRYKSPRHFKIIFTAFDDGIEACRPGLDQAQ